MTKVHVVLGFQKSLYIFDCLYIFKTDVTIFTDESAKACSHFSMHACDVTVPWKSTKF